MEAAVEVAKLAGDVALRSFGKPLCVETKAEAEAAAVAWLEERFPGDGVLSEERGLVRPRSARRWVMDPIDGTRTFLRGVPLWGTLVAVMEKKDVIAGAAYFPAIGETVAAAAGHGAWWNGARCHVSHVSKLSDAMVVTTDAQFAGNRERQSAWSTLARDVALVRTWGDCYGYLLVATGRADAMVDNATSPWDVVAMQVIIEEAGGVFTDWRGERSAWSGDAIATNRELAKIVRQRLQAGAP